ncbi:MAG TPA: deoxyribose-phosphate aldolase [Candidatus Acidoferrum sp.]|jgi:deoxyribose-phosphate aldolase
MTAPYDYPSIAKMIDHALLQPFLTTDELEAGCRLALTYDVASICILPYYVKRAGEILRGSGVQTSTTIGFPHGAHATNIKLAEARQALQDGATELDIVINISKAKSGDWKYVADEIALLTKETHTAGAKIKIIFENAYHDEKSKIELCRISGEAGADWVKTSTGYAPTGATLDDLRLMRMHSPAHVQVKAAGGIRDLDTILAAREIGVTRVGASRTSDILEDCRKRLGLPPITIAASGAAASSY